MIDEVKNLLNEVLLYSPKNIEELEQFRIEYLGKKGKMNDLFAAFKEVPKEIIRKELKYVPLYSSESGLVDAPKDVKEDKKK